MRALISLLVLFLTACSHVAAPPPVRPAIEDEEVGHDKPGEAAEYYADKRGGTSDPHASYALARSEMARMPLYSTAADSVLTRGPRIRAEAEGAREIDRWLPLGPGNIGGRTRVLIVDPVQPDVMYAGGVSGGLWKTNDAGRMWRPVADQLANLAINSLVMDPTDRNVLYAGTGEGYFREVVRGTALPLRGNGIFVTRDGANTWTQLASTTGPDFHWVNDLTISTHDPKRIYAATRTGVWRSNDAGATWQRTLDGSNVNGGCLEFAARKDTNGDYLFVSCGTFAQATVYRHKNAESDSAWEPVLSEPNMSRTSLAIAPSDPSIVYAMSASNESGTYNQGLLAVFRSDANGDAGSWTAQVTNKSPDYLSTLLLTNPNPATLLQCRGEGNTNQYVTMGWYCNTIAVDPTNPNRVWAAGVDLFRSDDGGKSWGLASYWWASTAATSFVHADQHGIVFDPRYDGTTNRTMYAINDGGVFRTDNPNAEVGKGTAVKACEVYHSKVEFRPLNRNYGVTQFYHGAVFPDGRRYIAGAQDNGTILGADEQGIDGWSMRFGGDGAYVAIDPVDPNIVYTSYQFARIAKSTDAADQFVPAYQGLNDDFLFITPFIIDPNEHRRLWTGGRSLWRTDNATTNWTRASAPFAGKVSALAVAPRNANLVLAGFNDGTIARNEQAVTATATTSWSTVKPREGFVSSLNFDPVDTNVVYATYAGFGGVHLWKSIDAGRTWSPLQGNLPDIPVHSLAIDPTRRTRIFLGTDLGVFVTTDGGTIWNIENTGFAAVVTEWVTIGQGSRGPAIYAFTHGRGAWRAELTPAGTRRRSTR